MANRHKLDNLLKANLRKRVVPAPSAEDSLQGELKPWWTQEKLEARHAMSLHADCACFPCNGRVNGANRGWCPVKLKIFTTNSSTPWSRLWKA